MNRFRLASSRRPLAVRSTLTAVGVALAASAAGSALFTVAIHDSLASGLVTFGMFGSLAALTAGVLAWEVASLRICPRCGLENPPATAVCAGCGYDVQARPRFACSEGHRVAYAPGLCDCGRRLHGGGGGGRRRPRPGRGQRRAPGRDGQHAGHRPAEPADPLAEQSHSMHLVGRRSGRTVR